MAFADWPTSDGHNMLLYPWLRDLRHTDKFVEHGHRLAGVLIGLVSIALVTVTFIRERRTWVRTFSVVILLAVISQGLLGGMRVRMNEQVLAMTHSITGGLFFTLCFTFAIVVRRNSNRHQDTDSAITPGVFAATMLLPFAVVSQYVLGGMFRHLGRMLYEHVAGAIVVTILVTIVAFCLFRSESIILRRRGHWLALALLAQISLGIGAWITKLGFPTLGWVATANSPAQNVICSLHTVGAMFVLATSTVAAVDIVQMARCRQLTALLDPFAEGSSLAATQQVSGTAERNLL